MMTYAALIKPFQHQKDGHRAWMTLYNQYAGKDKWEAEINLFLGHSENCCKLKKLL
jgi:hypothetical protein